eukprot:Nk52_evm1s169 gene=Nk52_evmTU1s169
MVGPLLCNDNLTNPPLKSVSACKLNGDNAGKELHSREEGKEEVDLVEYSLMVAAQQHCLNHYGELSEEERAALLKDICGVDLWKLQMFHRRAMENAEIGGKLSEDDIEPVPREKYFSTLDESAENIQLLDEYNEMGLSAVRRGEVAVLLLAGGQGTRLGTKDPKGMFNVGLPSGKSLFQLQAERLLKVQMLAGEGSVIPWYIMVSPSTRHQTKTYLTANKFFGLNPQQVCIFEQNTQPCVTAEGKIIMETRAKIARAPDGNGGLYSAVRRSGALEDMVHRGIKHMHVYCVDNILVKVADPSFVGFAIAKGADCAAKCVAKKSPSEPVGIICMKGGRYCVVEYSEIAADVSEARAEDGSLKFNCANIVNHLFSIEFLVDMCEKHEDILVHHIANKKIPTIDSDGRAVVPSVPNGMKLELFIFDVFPFSKNFAVMEVKREEEFSPLKNKSGTGKDCPETCREHLMKLHANYLRKAGVLVECEEGEPPLCEISPLVSYAGEGLEKYISQRGLRMKPSAVLSHL